MVADIDKTNDWAYRLVWGVPDKNMVVTKFHNEYFTSKETMDKKNKELLKEGRITSVFHNDNNDFVGVEINAY